MKIFIAVIMVFAFSMGSYAGGNRLLKPNPEELRDLIGEDAANISNEKESEMEEESEVKAENENDMENEVELSQRKAKKSKKKKRRVVAAEGDIIHKVWLWQESKECLWSLAEKYYGDPWLWKEIYLANKDQIDDPGKIYPKQELIIPKLEESEK